MALTARQQRFVEEYLIDLNATQAAIRAGYRPKAAQEQASRLLSNAKVAAAITAAQAERSHRTQVSQDRVIRELARLAFSDMGEVLAFADGSLRLRNPAAIPEDARRALQSVKVRRYTEGHGDDAEEVELTEFKLADKRAALELLGRHLGLFHDKLKLEGGMQVAASGTVKHEHTVSITDRIDALAAAFERAAAREEAGAVPGDGAGEPVAP